MKLLLVKSDAVVVFCNSFYLALIMRFSGLYLEIWMFEHKSVTWNHQLTRLYILKSDN